MLWLRLRVALLTLVALAGMKSFAQAGDCCTPCCEPCCTPSSRKSA